MNARVLALAVLAVAACKPAYFRDVAPTFVAVDAPVTEITPVPTAATVVVYAPGSFGADRNTNQPFTLVLESGTVLGQVPRYTWIAFQVPAGEQTIYSGVPEIGSVRPNCAFVTGTFEAGKIYVFTRNLRRAGPDDHPERALSLMSRLRIDPAVGQARVREQWAEFWAGCVATGAKARATMSPKAREDRAPGTGLTELKIPPPP